jgi:hypothetical protein
MSNDDDLGKFFLGFFLGMFHMLEEQVKKL